MIRLRQQDIFALYSLPYSKDHFLVRQFSENTNTFNNSTLSEQGFVIQPFEETTNASSIFIKNPLDSSDGCDFNHIILTRYRSTSWVKGSELLFHENLSRVFHFNVTDFQKA